MNSAAALPPYRFRTRGMTLLELLVVIAVVGVLAGLMLPAMAGARRKAAAVQCIANSKQIGAAVSLYAGDFGQAFPLAIYKPEPDPGPVLGFDDFIYSYLGTALSLEDQEARCIPTERRLRVFTCPSDKAAPPRAPATQWRRTYSMAEAKMASARTGPPLRDLLEGGVGVYYSSFWGPEPPANPADHARATESAVPSPGDTLLLVERPHRQNWAGNDHFAVTRTTGEQRACFATPGLAADFHGSGRFVYAYCDGRAELRAPEQTWGRRGSDLTWGGEWTLRADD